MELFTKTLETTGVMKTQHQLLLDESLPLAESSCVRVIKEADCCEV
jgi:hypothetical protein